MEAEAKCTNCKQRAARNICTEARSPHGGQAVEPTDSCDYFLENPAERHFVNALGLSGDQLPTEIEELEKAIAIGLPEDIELQARYYLGAAYRQVAGRAELPVMQMIQSVELTRALSEQEKAVRMDRGGAYGYFAQPIGRALLGSFDSLCVLRSRLIAEEQGQEAAVAFLEEKLRLCDYLSTSPLLRTLLEVGNFYGEQGANDKAATYYERIIHAEPVDRLDEQGQEAATREMAANNLRTLMGPAPAAASTGSGCMLIVAPLVLGLVGLWAILSSLPKGG